MNFGLKAVLGAACLSLLILIAAGPTAATDIGHAVKTNCTRCHSSKRICLNVGVKSKSAWESTINKMIGKGAKLPQSRVGEAVDYLSTLKPGTGPLCQ